MLLQDVINHEAAAIGQSNSTLLADKEIELGNLRKEKVEGHMTRACLQ